MLIRSENSHRKKIARPAGDSKASSAKRQPMGAPLTPSVVERR